MAAAVLVVGLFGAQSAALFQDAHSFLSHGRGGGQAGDFHAGQVDPAGSFGLFANDEIVHVQIGADACKVADGLAEVDAGHAALGSGLDKFQTAAGAGGVIAMDGHCIRAHDQVAVDGGETSTPLPSSLGHWKMTWFTRVPSLVQQIVLAAGRNDVEVGGLHHGVDLVGPDTGGVDDAAGFHRAPGTVRR